MPLMQPDFRLVVDRPLSERPRQNKWILLAWVVLILLGVLNMVHKVSWWPWLLPNFEGSGCWLAWHTMAHQGMASGGDFCTLPHLPTSSTRPDLGSRGDACFCCPAGYAPHQIGNKTAQPRLACTLLAVNRHPRICPVQIVRYPSIFPNPRCDVELNKFQCPPNTIQIATACAATLRAELAHPAARAAQP